LVAGPLLQHMRQLVAEELLAGGRVRAQLAGGEGDVAALSDGPRAQRGHRGRLGDAHAGEVGIEGALHRAGDGFGQGLAAGGRGQGWAVVIQQALDGAVAVGALEAEEVAGVEGGRRTMDRVARRRTNDEGRREA